MVNAALQDQMITIRQAEKTGRSVVLAGRRSAQKDEAVAELDFVAVSKEGQKLRKVHIFQTEQNLFLLLAGAIMIWKKTEPGIRSPGVA